MATARLIPSSYSVSNTSYLRVTNENNMYANTDSTNYATIQNTRTGTTSYYLYVRGFNFSAIPDNAIVNSFTVKFKANESGISTSTSYRPYLVNNTTTITSSCSVVNTSVQTLTFTGVSATWETIKGYGNNFGIRLNCRRNQRNTVGYMYFYGAEILVDYTVPVYHNITSTSTDGTAIQPSGTTSVLEGDSYTLSIDSESRPNIIDNNVDVSNNAVEKTKEISYEVTNVSTSYGFEINSNGYYESNNKARASTAAVARVDFNLPVECTVTFSLINYAESTYDYGLLSNIDTTLNTNASADTSNVFWNGSNKNSSSVQTAVYTIPAGEHYVYVKYFKDSYTDSNNDSLQFKVAITPNGSYTPGKYYEYTINNVTSSHTIVVTTKPTTKLMIKLNGNYVAVKKAFVKKNGVYVQETDLAAVFSQDKNYIYKLS